MKHRLRHLSRHIVLPGAVAAAAATAFAAEPTGANEAQIALKPEQVTALGVRAQTPVSHTATVSYPGVLTIPSGQQRVVATPLPGLIEALHVSVGDAVKAGQPIARIHSAQVLELVAELGGLRVQSEVAASALARDEALHREGLIAMARLEATRAQAALARAARDQREATLARLGPAGAGGVVNLVAPVSGVVVERPAAVGQRVDGATAVYRIAQLAPLWVELQVPAHQAESIRPGMNVRVRGADAPARVLATGSTVDPASQTVLVRAELRNPPPGLRAGQAVEAALERPEGGVLQVPDAAVVREGQRAYVFVQAADGRYGRVVVQPLSTAGGQTAVRGLSSGTKVVVEGTAALKTLSSASKS